MEELKDKLPISDLIELLVKEAGLEAHIRRTDTNPEERMENIEEFVTLAAGYESEAPENDLPAFLERASLVSDVDNYEETEDTLTLITLHQAKGLEFPVVFIVGLEEGLLPHSRSMDSNADLEEERRLCYVGLTRAKERLYLLRAFQRGMWGRTSPTLSSRFLEENSREAGVLRRLFNEDAFHQRLRSARLRPQPHDLGPRRGRGGSQGSQIRAGSGAIPSSTLPLARAKW